METAKIKSREVAFDYLRALSACGVIVIHVCAMQWRKMDVHSVQWLFIHFYDMLMKFSVPIFFMISGRFFLDPSREMPLDKLKDKGLRIIVAFLFWSWIYTLLNIFRVLMAGDSLKDSIKWIIVEFFSGEYHMWFLYAIFGLYLITPLVRKIIESKWLTEYFLTLFLIFGLIWPMVEQIPKIGVFFVNAGDAMEFHLTTGFVGYYILGYYLYRYPPKAKKRTLLYLLGMFGAVFSVVGTLIVSWRIDSASEELASYLTLNVAMTSAALYTAILNGSASKKERKVLLIISKYSFGCYLAHPLILWIFEWIGFIPSVTYTVISIPIISLITLILSLLIAIGFSKLPLLKMVI